MDAAAFAIQDGLPELGIELLERGRAILFSALGKLRMPMDKLEEVDSELAEEFRKLNDQLQGIVSGAPARVEDVGEICQHEHESAR